MQIRWRHAGTARLSLHDAHAIAHHAEQQLVRSVPRLAGAVVHAYPAHD